MKLPKPSRREIVVGFLGNIPDFSATIAPNHRATAKVSAWVRSRIVELQADIGTIQHRAVTALLR